MNDPDFAAVAANTLAEEYTQQNLDQRLSNNSKELAFVKHRQEIRRQRPVGPTRARLRTAGAKLLDLLGQERWGLPIVFVAAVIGIPPLYAVALIAGATTMRPLWFGLTVLVGRLCRFLLVASGFRGLHDWFI